MNRPMQSCSPIGVDVGLRSIAAVQLVGRGPSRRIGAALRLPRANPGGAFTGAEACRLRDVLERQRFAGRKVVLAAPDDKLQMSPLDLPPRSSGAPIEQLARLELARTHKLDAGAMEMAVWDMPAAAGANTGVLAAALAHADAEPLLAAFDGARLDVIAVEPRVCALCRVAARLCEPTAVTGIIELNESAAVLAVIHQWTVAYERVMPETGVGALRASIAKELNLQADVVGLMLDPPSLGRAPLEMPDDAAALVAAAAESLAEEAKAAVEYVSRIRSGPGDSGVFVTGAGAHVPGLLGGLEGGLGRGTRPLSPLEALGAGPDAASDPSLATAAGLAMHEEER